MEEVKKNIVRSAAYPAFTLEKAIEFAREVSLHFTEKQIITRHDIAAVLGKSHGYISRPVAALVHYAIFDKESEGYKFTKLFKHLKNPIDENDLAENKIEAFKSPTLFSELIQKYNGHVLPSELRTHLIRFHAIAEKVADNAAEIFIESAKYAGALNDKNILNVDDYKSNINNDIEPDEDHFEEADIIEEKEPVKQILSLNGRSNEESPLEEIPIRLKSGKHAYLRYPAEITKKDLRIIRKQIDVLEEYVDDEE